MKFLYGWGMVLIWIMTLLSDIPTASSGTVQEEAQLKAIAETMASPLPDEGEACSRYRSSHLRPRGPQGLV